MECVTVKISAVPHDESVASVTLVQDAHGVLVDGRPVVCLALGRDKSLTTPRTILELDVHVNFLFAHVRRPGGGEPSSS